MTNVLIVGAGPAGTRAAEVLVAAGLHPVVVDGAARAGGQIYRRPPEGFSAEAKRRYGSEAGKATDLHQSFDRMVAAQSLTHLASSSITAIGGSEAQVLTPDGVQQIAYDRLILATGATDRLLPVPGWQQAGVYSLGATQIALKAQGVALGHQMVLAGSGPLLTLVACQLIAAGAGVAAVLDTSAMAQQIRGGLTMARARPVVTFRGLLLRQKLGRRYHAGVSALEICSGPDGPKEIRWRDAKGRPRVTECDMVGLGWHIMCDLQLADLAGAEFQWSETWSQWLPVADEMGRISERFYMAGDGLCPLGADAAEGAGRLAAAACLEDLGLEHPAVTQDLHRLARMRRFARGVAQAFPLPAALMKDLPQDTIVCRCENVRKSEIMATAKQVGADINRVKSLSRAGMGRCQGRYCQRATAELIAMQTGARLPQVGRLRAQPPIRPLPVSAVLKDKPSA